MTSQDKQFYSMVAGLILIVVAGIIYALSNTH